MTDYIQSIEEAYGRCRERFSMLSPRDWQLASDWEKDGIPLNIVIRSIHDCCKKYKSKRRPDNINTLRYFDQEVRKQFAAWQSARVGAHDSQPAAPAEPLHEADLAINVCENILLAFGEAKKNASPELRDHLSIVIDAVFQIILEIEGTHSADQADDRLKSLAAHFDQALLDLTPASVKDQILQSSRRQWPNLTPDDLNRILLKETYAAHNLPRLTLFQI